jgi:hypothetical protein
VPRTIAVNLIKQRPLAGLVAVGLIGILNYGEHGPTFRNHRVNAGLDQNTGLSDHPREGCAYSYTAPPRLIQRF